MTDLNARKIIASVLEEYGVELDKIIISKLVRGLNAQHVKVIEDEVRWHWEHHAAKDARVEEETRKRVTKVFFHAVNARHYEDDEKYIWAALEELQTWVSELNE